ncbi:ribonuclease H-like domain-containing protein [Tanacetum coccineum]
MRNEMKALEELLLMALPNKDQLKFHSYKDAKLLMEAIEKRYRGNKESKKDQQTQAKIHKMWLLCPPTALNSNCNSSTNEADNTAYGVRARRFIKRTGSKLDVNGQRVRFDRTKVEYYNCHKNGHFARECRAPRNQESRGRDINRRTMTVETSTKNCLGSSSSLDYEVDSCSKSCVKAYATLKEQYDSLSSDIQKSF